jgi:hypothetical protein
MTWVIRTSIDLKITQFENLKMKDSGGFENCYLEFTAAGIEVESPKCASMCADGLVTDSPVALPIIIGIATAAQ